MSESFVNIDLLKQRSQRRSRGRFIVLNKKPKQLKICVCFMKQKQNEQKSTEIMDVYEDRSAIDVGGLG